MQIRILLPRAMLLAIFAVSAMAHTHDEHQQRPDHYEGLPAETLEKINEELIALADTLEAVHVASETADHETVKAKGREYLSVSRQVIE